jgi:HNH endonuclease
VDPYVAVTDLPWFDFLSSRAVGGRVDEVNFWSPRAITPLKRMTPGEPVFFRLKAPRNAIAGYGFFALFSVLALDEAWRLFEEGNGYEFEAQFLQGIGRFRGLDLLDPRTPQAHLGCTILRDARFWPPERWIPWGDDREWSRNIVRGETERDPARAALLLASIADDPAREDVEAELKREFVLVEGDERLRRLSERVVREGQGTFRARLLDAYGGACAVTGEHTEPVLAAAHIQPYLGPRSNNVQNGLLLTQEFHTLFDLGLVAVTPDYEVRISPQLKGRWQNGRRYYDYAGRRLALPKDPSLQPSRDALAWHQENLFVA